MSIKHRGNLIETPAPYVGTGARKERVPILKQFEDSIGRFNKVETGVALAVTTFGIGSLGFGVIEHLQRDFNGETKGLLLACASVMTVSGIVAFKEIRRNSERKADLKRSLREITE